MPIQRRSVRCSTEPSDCAIPLRRKSEGRADALYRCTLRPSKPGKVYASVVLLRSLKTIAIKAAHIGQAEGIIRVGSAIIGAGVVIGPRRAIIVAAASPRRVRKT